MAALHDWKDGDIELTICRLYPARSTKQNAYYHCCVVKIIRGCLSEALGEPLSHNETHEWLKGRFNHREIPTSDGVLTIARDTRSLDTAAFAAYIDACRDFCAEQFSVSIPDPIAISGTKTELRV